MPDLGSAYVNIIPKAPGIQTNMEKILGEGEAAAGAEASGGSLGKRLLKGLAAAGIATAVGNTLKDALEAGGALEQSFGGLETIYGDAAGQAKEFAMAAASAGISANDYAEQAVSFGASLKQAFGGDTQAAVEAANTAIMDMADNAAKMGTPIESIQSAYQGLAKQNYTMLDNLKLGYGASKAELERLLSDAKALTGVEYNIDNLGDVYDAIHVIQGELGLTGVAAGEASTTFTGSMGALQASWENVLAALTTGEGLDTALENLSASFGSFATNVIQMIANIAPQLPSLITGLADVILENAPTFITSGTELIAQLLVGLITSIPTIIAELPVIFSAIIDAFAGVDWAQLGIDIINGIIRGLVSMAGRLWEQIKKIVKGALTAGQNAAETGSPSKLFARELGAYIPPGIALGIEESAGVLDRAMEALMDDTLAAGRSAAPAARAETGSGDLEQILAAAGDRPVNVTVVLQGDAKRLFKVVRTENTVQTRRTNNNALAAAGV